MEEQIKIELKDFTEDVEIVEGFSFNHPRTIERIYNYYHSNFESGEFDSEGFKKFFFNISRNPANIGQKAIDFDTKDIKFLTAPGGNTRKTWLLERDLKFWMKEQNFGKKLNQVIYDLPKFGSAVLKIVDGRLHNVDLRNFVVEPSADSLRQANYVIEIHNYTPLEFKRIIKGKKWENTEEALENTEDGFVKVYERYGEDEDGDLSRIIIASSKENTVILDQEKVEDIPYREFHWEKIPGRWLGIGRVEIVFDPQIRMNEITNLKVKSSYWAALRIFQSRDEGIARNLLTDVKNGEILNIDNPISAIPTEERNLHAYTQEESRWLANRDENTLSFDVLRGERLPAGTPLGSATLAAGMSGAYYDIIRENLALDVKELFYNDIIPQHTKENSQEHILRIAGEDLDEIHQLMVDSTMDGKIWSFLLKNDKLPTQEQADIMRGVIEQRIKKGKEELLTIPANYYKDAKYIIDIVITGEQLDTSIKAATLFAALQAITADPTMITNPVKKKFFTQWLEQGGINSTDFITTETPTLQETIQKGVGGGVSAPKSITPAPMRTPRRERV